METLSTGHSKEQAKEIMKALAIEFMEIGFKDVNGISPVAELKISLFLLQIDSTKILVSPYKSANIKLPIRKSVGNITDLLTSVLTHCGTWAFFESSVINLIFSYYLLSLVLNHHNDDKADWRYKAV